MTDFSTSPHAPYTRGSVPAAGWFCIETTFRHRCPNPEGMLRAHGVEPGTDPLATAAAHGMDTELATEDTLRALAETYRSLDAGGRGLLLTRDHAGMNDAQDTRACGWIRALHAEGRRLWAYIELTPYGHAMVDAGEYTYFSTEYDYAEFTPGANGATPTRLRGCTLTNMPRHAAQVPCTNSRKIPNSKSRQVPSKSPEPTSTEDTPDKTMNNTDPNTEDDLTQAANNTDNQEDLAATNSDTTPEDDPQQQQDTNCDTPDKDDAAANSDVPGEMDMEAAAVAMAELLELPDTCTPADLLDAVRSLADSNAELRDALAEANQAADSTPAMNSRRYPNLCRAMRAPRHALNGKKPNGTVNVRINGTTMAVNSQAKSRADFCTAAVARREKALGRPLTPAEYNSTYNKANADYSAGTNR